MPRSCEADIRDLSLSAAAKEEKKKKSVSWGGRARGSCEPTLKTCPREGARFLGGSPVVLRGLCCHVCCDSALQFLKTFCRIDCNLFFIPSFQTPSGKIGREKKIACVRKEK